MSVITLLLSVTVVLVLISFDLGLPQGKTYLVSETEDFILV